ncbi:hypothetical protein DNTS_011405 [Danionella cerebrum]|uniref:Actin-related protein 8 n=1 Tax=Danionella cerebrum TaxID=2873325 RepID=A0A553PVX0_9TELE|nr:hypothetical protein DNTS_011405 [Danionella translucida]TRY81839.1 hypothetical protein DNTS_011405 [Danionella translucida]
MTMIQADREVENGRDKEKEREKEQRGIKRPIMPAAVPEPIQEQIQANFIIVIHPGSKTLRIGRATDTLPCSVPHLIARKHKKPGQARHEDQSLLREGLNGTESNEQRLNGMKMVDQVIWSKKMSNGVRRTPVSAEQARLYNRQVRPAVLDSNSRVSWTNTSHQPEYLVGEEALYLKPSEGYSVHWPICRGRLNIQSGAGGSLTAYYRCILLVPDIYNRQHVKGVVDMLLIKMGFSVREEQGNTQAEEGEAEVKEVPVNPPNTESSGAAAAGNTGESIGIPEVELSSWMDAQMKTGTLENTAVTIEARQDEGTAKTVLSQVGVKRKAGATETKVLIKKNNTGDDEEEVIETAVEQENSEREEAPVDTTPPAAADKKVRAEFPDVKGFCDSVRTYLKIKDQCPFSETHGFRLRNLLRKLKEENTKAVDVLFLQETHSDMRNALDWSREWPGQVLLSHQQNSSAGVGLLLSPRFQNSVVVHQESVCATFGSGLSSACVVDVGDQKTSVCCVEDGVSHRNSRLCLAYGGSDVTRCFFWLMQRAGFPYRDCQLTNRLDCLLLQQLKESFCHLDQDISGLQDHEFRTRFPESPVLLYQLRLGDEKLQAPMALFYPAAFGIVGQKMTRLLHRSEGDPEDPHDEHFLLSTQSKQDQARVIYALIDACYSTPQTQQEGFVPQTQQKGCGHLCVNEMQGVGFNASSKASAERRSFSKGSGYEGESSMCEVSEKGHLSQDLDLGHSQAEVDVEERVLLSRKTAVNQFEGKALGIDKAILHSIDSCASDETKRKMYSCILVVGGGLQFHGTQQFLQHRILNKMPPSFRCMVENVDEQDAAVVVWKGGSLLACLDSTQELWIHQQDWKRFGVRMLRERAAFVW